MTEEKEFLPGIVALDAELFAISFHSIVILGLVTGDACCVRIYASTVEIILLLLDE